MQAASLLVMPMLEAGYEAGEDIVDEAALQVMVTNMFDPPDELASARAASPLSAASRPLRVPPQPASCSSRTRPTSSASQDPRRLMCRDC